MLEEWPDNACGDHALYLVVYAGSQAYRNILQNSKSVLESKVAATQPGRAISLIRFQCGFLIGYAQTTDTTPEAPECFVMIKHSGEAAR